MYFNAFIKFYKEKGFLYKGFIYAFVNITSIWEKKTKLLTVMFKHINFMKNQGIK